jgi:hypothetical protein
MAEWISGKILGLQSKNSQQLMVRIPRPPISIQQLMYLLYQYRLFISTSNLTWYRANISGWLDDRGKPAIYIVNVTDKPQTNSKSELPGMWAQGCEDDIGIKRQTGQIYKSWDLINNRLWPDKAKSLNRYWSSVRFTVQATVVNTILFFEIGSRNFFARFGFYNKTYILTQFSNEWLSNKKI